MADLIGVVGLGNIGRRVATRLGRLGIGYLTFDVDPAAADAIDPRPEVVGSPRELALACPVVAISVFDEQQVRDVVLGGGGRPGLADAGRPDLVAVVVSTIEPAVVREIAAAAAPSGVRIVDAGVTPGFAIDDGEAVSFVGGRPEDVERALPLLSAYSSHVLHVGDLGAGMAAKIARNVATYCTWRAMYEAARIAQTAGVALDKLLEGIGVGDSRSLGRPGGAPGIVLSRRGTSDEAAADDAQIEWLQFLNATMQKDLGAAERLAQSLGLDLPVLAYTSGHTAETIGLPVAMQTARY